MKGFTLAIVGQLDNQKEKLSQLNKIHRIYKNPLIPSDSLKRIRRAQQPKKKLKSLCCLLEVDRKPTVILKISA